MTAIAPPQPPPAPRRRMDYVDALRGLACLWVILHHSYDLYQPHHGWAEELLFAMSRIGWLGVHLFLVLSGFCLYYPLVRKAAVADIRLNVREFGVRRARRILPPYYAAMALFIITALLHLGRRPWQHISAPNLAAHLLMLHNLSPKTAMSINSSFWTLALESQLYLIFPALVWLAGRRGLASMLWATVPLSIAWQSFFWLHDGARASDQVAASHFFAMPGCCCEFAAGMVAAALVARPVPGQQRVAAGIALGCLALSFACIASPLGTGPLFGQLWGAVFGCLLVILSRAPEQQFKENPLLKALTWVGIMSYSLYLIHQPLLEMAPPARFHLTSYAAIAGFGLVRFAALVALGFAFYLAVERPSILAYTPVPRDAHPFGVPPAPPPIAT